MKNSFDSKHEALDPAHANDAQSLDKELSSEEDLDEWLKGELEKHMNECRAVYKNKQKSAPEVDLKNSSKDMEDTINDDNFTRNLPNQSPLAELNPGGFLLPFTIGNYNSYAMANIDASNNVMPRSICEYLMLDNLEGASMSDEMDNLTQRETLGTVKNASVKIDKFEFPYDFVVTDMPKNLGEMIILGRSFLETIHAQIDDTRCHTRDTSNQNIPNNDPTPLSLEHSELGNKVNISESSKIQPFRPRPCDYSFDEWLKVKIGHTDIYNSDREIVFNEWILDSFDAEEEYVKEIGFEEEELWRSKDEKTEYEPPFVDIKTFKVKKYSFKRGQSFICITKHDDDALPLGRVNGARFKAVIRKELKDKDSNSISHFL
ncbi:reverse transcriptase domain-containing protein [Tanacetum coccineum]